MADLVSRIVWSGWRRHLPTFAAAIPVAVFVLGIAGPTASADENRAEFKFDEQRVEFHNQGVKLAGSLLLPKSEEPVPAVVFVHGAGQQTREPYREVGRYFASRGIAALIYDKRGTGQSGGAYESYEPYENLVNDALSAIAFLKERREIAGSQIGIWGLSQGAYISAIASSRSEDIQFIIVAGADATDGSMFYYRDNLFRRYGLSHTLRDLAEKLHLVEQDLHRSFLDGFRLSLLVPRSYPPPDQYVHPAWRHVHKPVLAMWGQLDNKAPVGESVAGLKNSLAQANNENWTIIILPRTNHDLKISETGAIQSKSYGYPPAGLQTMTDWAWSAIHRPSEIGKNIEAEIIQFRNLPPLRETVEDIQHSDEVFFGYYENGNLLGVISLEYRSKFALVCRLAVAPPSFRRGIASVLLHHIEAQLSQDGLRALDVSAASENAPALALYRKHGFQIVRRGATHDGLCRTHLRKTISPHEIRATLIGYVEPVRTA